MPFTAEELTELIARARLVEHQTSRRQQCIATLAAKQARRHSATIRLAVRYVRIAHVPVPEARRTIAELTGQWPSLTAIRDLWNKLYPGEPRPLGKAGGSRPWQRRRRSA
jgi:hypothetical protein